MKIKCKIPPIVLGLLLILSCNEKKYDEFEFSYGNTFETDFSIKFTQNDSVYLRENWSPNDSNDDIPYPKSNTNYTAILTKKEKEKLNTFLNKIDFKKFDTAYIENYQDGEQFNLYFKKNYFEKTIFVRSHHSPQELDSLKNWIVGVKRNLKLTKTKKVLAFKSKFNPIPPPPPPLSN
ncbi:hypothetical protein BXY58_1837 [Epilithonimonas arachidiradicis]|uniref:Uncharacterized protein n=2 Tax=Epilithonimonas arachidiradicis TaxID=1617282 RepID=A0A420D9K2_9FLAO|nr:hypothetical protein BXY58_1837 [Epilithonimonas arachidiradicis]